jgi:hypothetical protein
MKVWAQSAHNSDVFEIIALNFLWLRWRMNTVDNNKRARAHLVSTKINAQVCGKAESSKHGDSQPTRSGSKKGQLSCPLIGKAFQLKRVVHVEFVVGSLGASASLHHFQLM